MLTCIPLLLVVNIYPVHHAYSQGPCYPSNYTNIGEIARYRDSAFHPVRGLGQVGYTFIDLGPDVRASITTIRFTDGPKNISTFIHTPYRLFFHIHLIFPFELLKTTRSGDWLIHI
ncbi:MAG TPA: hypothetical protein VH796_18600 [Nitrososphaeraceae archaeon]